MNRTRSARIVAVAALMASIAFPAMAGDTITVMTGQPTDRTCPPERARGDADFLEALNAVTSWRREGDLVRLIGPKTLRFRVPTN